MWAGGPARKRREEGKELKLCSNGSLLFNRKGIFLRDCIISCLNALISLLFPFFLILFNSSSSRGSKDSKGTTFFSGFFFKKKLIGTLNKIKMLTQPIFLYTNEERGGYIYRNISRAQIWKKKRPCLQPPPLMANCLGRFLLVPFPSSVYLSSLLKSKHF